LSEQVDDHRDFVRAVRLALVGVVATVIVAGIVAQVTMGATVIRIENQSSRELRSLQVSGNGFDERVPRLGAGESVCVRPSGIRGESGLEFRAHTDAGIIEGKDLAYLEAGGGYRVEVDVSPDLKVRASTGSLGMAFCGVWH
jgi:hypothetical protein